MIEKYSTKEWKLKLIEMKGKKSSFWIKLTQKKTLKVNGEVDVLELNYKKNWVRQKKSQRMFIKLR